MKKENSVVFNNTKCYYTRTDVGVNGKSSRW